MKSLDTIQKTFRVFQIITKIAYILSIVGASICAVGVLCVITWQNGGQVFSLLGEPIVFYGGTEGIRGALSALLTDMIFLITDAVLLFFAGRYIKTELAEGTPFTENGANIIRKLGIRFIYMPIVAAVISAVITVCLDVQERGDVSNLPGLITGLVLILASVIFRYGAELERKAHEALSENTKPEE
ncbi:MAG: hypothetical protein Q4C14_06145 [Bacillota bacterium]|nr:hypothetical protein [Bacillota bacterium]